MDIITISAVKPKGKENGKCISWTFCTCFSSKFCWKNRPITNDTEIVGLFQHKGAFKTVSLFMTKKVENDLF